MQRLIKIIVFVLFLSGVGFSVIYAKPQAFLGFPIKLPEPQVRINPPTPDEPPGVLLRKGGAPPNDIGRLLKSILQTLFLSPSIYDGVLFTPQAADPACVSNTVLEDSPMFGYDNAKSIIDAANAAGVNPLFIFGIASAESSFCNGGPKDFCENNPSSHNPYGLGCPDNCNSYSSWAAATTASANSFKDYRDNYGATTMEDLVCDYVLGPNSLTCKNKVITSGIREYVSTVVGIMDKLSQCVAGGLPKLPQPPGTFSGLVPPPQKHRICLDQKCVLLDGPGVDRCTNDGDCRSQHTTCSGTLCVLVYEPGDDECIPPDLNDPNNPNNNNLIGFPGKCPLATHKECVKDQLSSRCATVPGPGPDTCVSDIKCQNPPEPPDVPECSFICMDRGECLRLTPPGRIVDGDCSKFGGGVCCRWLNLINP